MLALLCILFVVTFQKGFHELGLVGVGVVTVALVTAGNTAVDDLYDRDSDALTHPERPVLEAHLCCSRRGVSCCSVPLLQFGSHLRLTYFAFSMCCIMLDCSFCTRMPSTILWVREQLGYGISRSNDCSLLGRGRISYNECHVALVRRFDRWSCYRSNVLKDILTFSGTEKWCCPTPAAKQRDTHGSDCRRSFPPSLCNNVAIAVSCWGCQCCLFVSYCCYGHLFQFLRYGSHPIEEHPTSKM